MHLLNDGWMNAYDCAVVVTNDSDIAEAMRLVRQHHDKRIGLVTPGAVRPSRQLMAHADFSRHRLERTDTSVMTDRLRHRSIQDQNANGDTF